MKRQGYEKDDETFNAEEDADRVADWCENNRYGLEGENYREEGIEKAKEALKIS